jgi:mono/diheme cytochrome c family protein
MTGCGGAQDTGTSGDNTTTTALTTTTISAEQLAKAEAVGDIAAGEELFFTELAMPASDIACSTCHTLDGVDGRAPSLFGISALAGERVEGLTDIEYLRQSIIDPAAYEEDWPATMPRTFADELSDEQVTNLVAFLLTQ